MKSGSQSGTTKMLAQPECASVSALPDGVPEAMMSPGWSVMAADMVEMMEGMEKMRRFVRES